MGGLAINGTRVINAALSQEQLADWLVADYVEGYRSLADDLRPQSLERRSRVLGSAAGRMTVAA